jgi:Tol biopolymer transport system component
VPAIAGDPNIAVGDVTVYEGDSGPAVVTIPVDLSTTSTSAVSVNYTVVGDLTGAGDVPTTAGSLTFAAGDTEKTIPVTITGDSSVEHNGNVQVHLSAPSHAHIEDGTGAVLVRDDDTTSTTNALSIGDATVIEADSGTRYAYVPLTLADAPPAGTTVKVSVLSGCDSAAPAADTATSGTITFRAGQRAKMLKYAIAGDTTPERKQVALKTVRLQVGNAVVRVPNGAVTIDDNDGTPPPDTEQTPWGDSELISQSSDGQLAAFPSAACNMALSSPFSISADGNYVAFESGAGNLVPDDTNDTMDLFVRDRITGTTERVDVKNDGSELSGGGGQGFISDDGRYVAFSTPSPDLAPPNGDLARQGAFVRDRSAGTTTNVGILPDGTSASWAMPSGISPDGRYVPFISPSPWDGPADLYVRDLMTSTTRYVAPTVATGGVTPMTDSGEIAFTSSDPTLVPGDTNGFADIFVENLATGAIERVNVTNTGEQDAGPTNPPYDNLAREAISRDGRYVVFLSRSENMGVPTGQSRVLIRDRVAGTTEVASVIDTTAPLCFSHTESVSNDGRYVSFSAMCEDAEGNTQSLVATMVRDRLLGTTTRVDTLADGTPGNANAGGSVMSADGKWVAYGSSSTNFVTGDTNNMPDVFIRKIS